jgi:cell division protein FtsB
VPARRAGRRATSRREASPPTRADRRISVRRRRSVVGLLGALIFAAVVLVAWFPAGALVTQRNTLAATNASIRQLQVEDRALSQETKRLTQPSEIERIARQQYQLVSPGQEAFEVLPPSGSQTSLTDPYTGDPGDSGVVSPSASPELPPGQVPAAPITHSTSSTAKHPNTSPGLLGRIVHTLEFWR